MLVYTLLVVASTAFAAFPKQEVWQFDVAEEGYISGHAPDLSIINASLTSKWFEGSDFVQIVEMNIHNSHPTTYLTSADAFNVTLISDSLELINSGSLIRLAPYQSALVQIGVQNKPDVLRGAQCSAEIKAIWGQGHSERNTTHIVSGVCGIPDYTASIDSLHFHSTPDWFNDIKFGIFIHWGLYSAPAFGSVQPDEDYAEWYWCRMHKPDYKTHTYQYHLDTYGADFEYDHFMRNFTDVGWDPKEWVDLFAEAGARYIVPVTKHHDGFLLFESKTTQRSSLHYGPTRDLTRDLLDAAAKYQPQMRRGTYFSMPEWYNPAYAPYRNSDPGWDAGTCIGYPNTNPYTNQSVEYTGYMPVGDFVTDVQLPQMKELVHQYDTELMWCDIGGANNATIFASEWLNWAREQGRQVTFNDRCGIPGDFATPEYATNGDTVVAKWESSRGMDPFSYGFNYQTPNNQYLTGEAIVRLLVDIVSKNGNFLLDIGPTQNGSIPQIMQQGLRDAGSWIIPHGEGVFNTRFWSKTPGTGNLRYTTTADAFFVFHMGEPPITLLIEDPIPWLPGDIVTSFGGGANGTAITTSRNDSGIVFHIPKSVIQGDKYVWGIKILYE